MNDISAWVALAEPEDVEDPEDPDLDDLLRHASCALGQDGTPVKAATLADLMGQGLDFQEAVVWYWFRWCQFDLTDIHYAMSGSDVGGDPEQRRNATRNILRVLESAARQLPDADPEDIPDLVDDRKRHDRTDADVTTDNGEQT